MLNRVFVFYFLAAVIVTGPQAARAEEVQAAVEMFTIVAPAAVVDDGSPFKITVIESDVNWNPIVPGAPDAVTLSAREQETGNPVSIFTGENNFTGSSFTASGTGADDIMVKLIGVTPDAHVEIMAAGYGVGPAGPNAPSVQVVSPQNLGVHFDRFEISAPFSANPNEPFPIYITPVEEINGAQHREDPAPFAGVISLEVDEGSISSPDGTVDLTALPLDLAAGASEGMYVILDAVSPTTRIHIRVVQGDGAPIFNVTFTNKNTAQLDAADSTIAPDVTPGTMALSTLGVNTSSQWESMIWPIDPNDSDLLANGDGWNMVTVIPGAGLNGQGVAFHTLMLPGDIPQASLPGDPDFWHLNTVSTDPQDPNRWEPIAGSDPFPAGFAGTFWFRRQFFSYGDVGKTNTSFINNSPMLDRVIQFVEQDGTPDTELAPASDFGIKGVQWDNMIWRSSLPGGGDSVFQMISSFTTRGAVNDPDATVYLYSVFVPASRPQPTIPDGLWNFGDNDFYVIDTATDFASVTGDALPADFDGSYRGRFHPLGFDDQLGWSNRVNTTGVHVPATTLHVDRVFAVPDDIAVVEVTLTHLDDPVAGLQFRIANDPRLDFQGVVNHLDNQGFSISSAPVDGNNDENAFLVVNLQGNPLTPGEDTVMQLLYHVGDAVDGVAFGDTLDLTVSGSVISDPNSQALPHEVWDGLVTIAKRGDLAGGEVGDGAIDVLDVVALVDIIVGRVPSPPPASLEFFRADINEDDAIDILDVVRVVNVIIGRATAKPVAGTAGPVRLSLGDLTTGADGRPVVPVRAQFDGAIAGLQLTLSYDPSVLTFGEAIPSPGLTGMQVDQYASNGRLRLVIFSAAGQVFRMPDSGALVNLPVIIRDRAAEGVLALSRAVAAGPQAEKTPVTLSNGEVKVAAVPTAFTLGGNRPNPFNPSTRIEYEVPQQAHVTLSVYNILGQEVVRLVDRVQSPGRYTVTWNGRNTQGMGVASGVYLYRLTSSTGFTQTRRMTLLK